MELNILTSFPSQKSQRRTSGITQQVNVPAVQAWLPEVKPRKLHKCRKRQVTPQSCPVTSTQQFKHTNNELTSQKKKFQHKVVLFY